MTVKEYLQQIYIIHRKVNRLNEQCEQLRSDLYSIGSPSGKMDADKVQTSLSGDTMLRLIAKVDKAERNLQREKERLIDTQTEIISQINRMTNENQKDVLSKRYIEFSRWEQIAVDMNITVRHVYRIHGAALQAFKKMYNDVIVCHETL